MKFNKKQSWDNACDNGCDKTKKQPSLASIILNEGETKSL